MIKEKSKIWRNISIGMGRFVIVYSPLPAGFYTILSLFVAILAVICSAYEDYVSAISLFIMAGVLDVVDGSVARARNQATQLGAFIDGTIDRFVDFAIIFSFFFFKIKVVGLELSQWICIASFVVIMPSFVVAYANHRHAVNDDNETLIWRLMNRGEMLFMMMGILITSLFSPDWAGYLLIILIFLSTVTIIQTIFATIYHAKQALKRCSGVEPCSD